MCVSAILRRIQLSCDSPGLTVQWAEDNLQQGKRISVPEDVYDQGCVKDVDEGLEVNAEPGGPGARTSSLPWWWWKLSDL